VAFGSLRTDDPNGYRHPILLPQAELDGRSQGIPGQEGQRIDDEDRRHQQPDEERCLERRSTASERMIRMDTVIRSCRRQAELLDDGPRASPGKKVSAPTMRTVATSSPTKSAVWSGVRQPPNG
jgi:hypothetical protein